MIVYYASATYIGATWTSTNNLIGSDVAGQTIKDFANWCIGEMVNNLEVWEPCHFASLTVNSAEINGNSIRPLSRFLSVKTNDKRRWEIVKSAS